jgi:glycogen(starch) synthase
MPEESELLTKEDKVKIKRCLYSLQRNGLPPITTHNVTDDWNDPVLCAIRRCQLFNTIHDRVKVRKVKTFLQICNTFYTFIYYDMFLDCVSS